MFGLVRIIMPLHARTPYPKPWLQHTRGSKGERSPQIFSSEKKQRPRHGGEMLWKKQRCSHFSSGKKQSPWKVGTLIFFTAFPPMSGTLFFFRTEIFGLFSPSLPLVRWSQSFGYGFLASYDIKICTRPNIFLSKVPKKSSWKAPEFWRDLNLETALTLSYSTWYYIWNTLFWQETGFTKVNQSFGTASLFLICLACALTEGP